MTTNRNSIGQAIRTAREERGLSQTFLAAFLRVGRTQLVNVERGASPSLATVEEVADALNASFLYRPHQGWFAAPSPLTRKAPAHD